MTDRPGDVGAGQTIAPKLLSIRARLYSCNRDASDRFQMGERRGERGAVRTFQATKFADLSLFVGISRASVLTPITGMLKGLVAPTLQWENRPSRIAPQRPARPESVIPEKIDTTWRSAGRNGALQ